MSLSDFLSNLKNKLSRKQISDKPLVPSARKKIRRSQKKMKKFESMNEYDNLRNGSNSSASVDVTPSGPVRSFLILSVDFTRPKENQIVLMGRPNYALVNFIIKYQTG